MQNLLDGNGWVYNLASPTSNAVSAPLYTLALALISLVVGSVELASTLLFVFTTAASEYLAFAILHKNSMTLGGLVAICLMIINPWLLVTQGLETSAFVCLLLLSVLLLADRRHAAVGFVLVAATLVRGDGAVLVAVVFFLLWIQTKHFPWRLGKTRSDRTAGVGSQPGRPDRRPWSFRSAVRTNISRSRSFLRNSRVRNSRCDTMMTTPT
ncbi:hypothetical protein WIS52_01090 [Pseudonocardia nematodicida]|uniref:Glycosyltransferase RgtA/B/C/D-like domain-containing protein n=1 Tax=Pseudonocardia nematodicida TaxID=1206997 RepID=A0ABV1K3M6_9PSEU